MRSSAIVVADVLANNPLEMAFADGNEEVQTLAADRSYQPLAVGVRLGRADRRSQDTDTESAQCFIDGRRENRIAVVNQVAVDADGRQRSAKLARNLAGRIKKGSHTCRTKTLNKRPNFRKTVLRAVSRMVFGFSVRSGHGIRAGLAKWAMVGAVSEVVYRPRPPSCGQNLRQVLTSAPICPYLGAEFAPMGAHVDFRSELACDSGQPE